MQYAIDPKKKRRKFVYGIRIQGNKTAAGMHLSIALEVMNNVQNSNYTVNIHFYTQYYIL
jgi:hypothetical protein